MSSEHSSLLEDLTPAQLQAVTHRDGPMLVVAGAGSGKTRVVTRRLAWLLSQGVWPNQILAMTFTNKAAREMRERVETLTGHQLRNLGTFHGVCARFLRQDIEHCDFGRNRNFVIYDESDRLAVLKNSVADLELTGLSIPVKQVANLIGESKNKLCSAEDCIRNLEFCPHPELFLRLCVRYEEKMRQLNAVDFDDLLFLTVKMLQQNPALLEIYQNRLRYLLIDEYQDTNHLQYVLMRLLAGQHGNVHVTGDPDQCIYTWRGADYRNIMDFARDFPEAVVVKLEQNYRSTQNILEAANGLICQNQQRIDKTLFTENEKGAPVECFQLADEKAEAEWIWRKADTLQKKGIPLHDIAIFYRTNGQARSIEESLIQKNMPYQILGGLRFYDRKEVKDFIAFLRLKANPNDELALKRTLDCRSFGIGPKTLQVLCNAAEQARQPILVFAASEQLLLQPCCAGKGKKAGLLREFSQWCRELLQIEAPSLEQLVRTILDHSGLKELLFQEYGQYLAEERIEHLDSLLGRTQEYVLDHPEADLPAFLADLALVSDVDSHDPQANCLTLMTLHSSKGLEFPYVMIAGVENGLLPYGNNIEDEQKLEEERRLFYVGITRARKAVYLLYCMSRFFWGKRDYNRQPSHFLKDLPKNNSCCKFTTPKPSRRSGFYPSPEEKYQRLQVFPEDDLPIIYQD
ncbi:MAG: UvrD-helicase domain-containing protein [Lentisphaeria bacterium]